MKAGRLKRVLIELDEGTDVGAVKEQITGAVRRAQHLS